MYYIFCGEAYDFGVSSKYSKSAWKYTYILEDKLRDYNCFYYMYCIVFINCVIFYFYYYYFSLGGGGVHYFTNIGFIFHQEEHHESNPRLKLTATICNIVIIMCIIKPSSEYNCISFIVYLVIEIMFKFEYYSKSLNIILSNSLVANICKSRQKSHQYLQEKSNNNVIYRVGFFIF